MTPAALWRRFRRWAAGLRRSRLVQRFRRPAPPWRIDFVDGDILPATLPERCVVVTSEDGEPWSAGLACPCGCGDMIELPLFPEADQHWRVRVGDDGLPSLSPSVWRRTGCRSHFWLRRGRIHWC